MPFRIVLCVTARCHLKCVLLVPTRKDVELAADKWCHVLDQWHALGTERVVCMVASRCYGTIWAGWPLTHEV